MRRQWIQGSVATVIAALSAACGGEMPVVAAPATRDSAGIRIIENPLDSASLPVWRIPDSAVADIGGDDDGPGALQRARTALWDRGTILIGDGASAELRRFDSTGRHVESWGRRGDGPGEFRRISSAWSIPPDSLAVYDGTLRRITVFSDAGEPVRTVSLRTLPYTYTVQPLDDRVMLGFIPIDTSKATSGPTRRSRITVTAGDPDSLELDTLVVLPAFETYPILGREGEATFAAQSMPIFGKGMVLRTDGSHILAAVNDAFEVAEYDGEGKLRRLIRLAVPRSEVTDADHAAYVAQELQAIDDFNPGAPEAFREQWRAALRERRVASHFPFVDELIVADDGSLWVEVYRWRRDEPRRYFVFDSAGALIARAEAPLRARPTAVRSDRILALWRDADDIEHVRVYPIRR